MSNFSFTWHDSGIKCADGSDAAVECEFDADPGWAGSYWEPPEPATFELTSAKVGEFELIGFLHEEQIKTVEDLGAAAANEQAEDCKMDAAEARAQDRQELLL